MVLRPGHAEMFAWFSPGEVSIHQQGDSEETVTVGEGMVHVRDDEIILLHGS